MACRVLVTEGDYEVTPYQSFDRRKRTKVISLVETGHLGLNLRVLSLPADVVGGT